MRAFPHPLPAKQRGVAALEFALVLSVLLLMLGGIVGLSGMVWVQQKLTGAATEGVRAMLDSKLSGAIDTSVACRVARDSVTWMTIGCATAQKPCTWSGGASNPTVQCATVSLTYDTGTWPVLAMMRNLSQTLWRSSWVPQTMTANAVVQIQETL